MTPEQIGYIIGAVLVVVLAPLAIYLVGFFISRNKEPAARAALRKRFLIGSLVTFLVVLAAAAVSNIDRFEGTNIERMRAGMISGCTNRCVQRTKQEDACRKMCVCVSDRFIKDVGEKRLAAMSSPKDMTSQDRSKLIAAALQCRRLLPKAKTQ